jgi:hypothetical protein
MSEYLSRSAVAKAVARRLERHERAAEYVVRDNSPEIAAAARPIFDDRIAQLLELASELGLSCGCCGHMMLDEDMVCHGDCTDRECGRHKR